MPAPLRHPISLHTYTALSGDRVRVARGKAWGLFTESGIWVDGDIRSADPTFCRWVASAHAMPWRKAAKRTRTSKTKIDKTETGAAKRTRRPNTRS